MINGDNEARGLHPIDPRKGPRPLDPAKPPAVGGPAPKPPKLPILEISQNLTTGHLRLRRDKRSSPAQVALCFVIQQYEENVGRLSCHRRNLLHYLRVDLKKWFILLETYDDIIQLRELASDRKYWSNIF